MTKKNLIVVAALSIIGVTVANYIDDNAELLRLKKENRELLDTVHWCSELTEIDREYGKRVANADHKLSALEKEQIRHQVIIDHVNKPDWKANIEK